MKYFRSYTDALRRILPIVVLSAIAISEPVWAENPLGKVVYILDFSGQANGDAKPWLKANGFQFKLDADGKPVVHHAVTNYYRHPYE
jgi:hypothetical protein